MTEITDAAVRQQSTTSYTRQSRSTDVFVRNYDPYWGYDLSMEIETDTGRTVYEDRTFFQPGQIQSLSGVLDPGEYAVTVVLDDQREKSTTCQVGPDPRETIHVEIGNGLVSLTEGLYG